MSRTILEMPNALAERLARSRYASNSSAWLPQKENVGNLLQLALADWIKVVSENEALFKKNVYENNDIADTDIRQHRSWICRMIADGELIAVGFIGYGEETGNEKEFHPAVDLIDQKLKKLFESLLAWHGPMENQSDIPESFKQASRESDEGKVEEMDI